MFQHIYLLWRMLLCNFRYRGSVRNEARALVSRMGAVNAIQELELIRETAADASVRVFAYNVEREIQELSLDPRDFRVCFEDIRRVLLRPTGVRPKRVALRAESDEFDVGELQEKFRMARLAPATPLTERQLECLEWAAQGKSSADIAIILGLSKRTVDEHLGTACEKLGVKTRVQAAGKLLEIRGLYQSP